MRIILLLTFIALCEPHRIPRQLRDADPQQPPQPNPNVNLDEGHEYFTRDPLAAPRSVKKDTTGVSDANCNLPAIVAASGDAMVKLVAGAPPRCLYDMFSFNGANAKSACNEADMTSVANAFVSVSANYDGNKPASSPGILNYVLYLRACYYVQSSSPKDVGSYSANLLPIVKRGIDNYLKRNVEAKNADNFEITREVITLVSNTGDSLNYAGPLSVVLAKLGDDRGQGEAINAIFDNLFRSHNDVAAATTYYGQHPEVATNLNAFMDKRASFVGTQNEWLLRNAGGELARLLKYQQTYATVSGFVKKQMSKYLADAKGLKVWAWMANIVSSADAKNCAQFNACNIKGDMEKKVLTYTKTCAVTRADTFKIRAQQLSDAEADIVCKRLKDQETYFHGLVKDNWRPVSPDLNSLIEVVVFNDVDEYKLWANLIFGINTDNGGMYIEGNPGQQGNVARYFCYEQPNNGKFDVWNLEHEFTHYLDGRYDMVGNFADTSKYRTVWWGEGFAEYAANKNNYPSMVNSCKAKKYTLSQIFNTTYNGDTERIYYYGYLAARYMFERHRADADAILGFFRSNKYQDYENFLNGIGTKYDQDFIAWCGQLAG